MKNPLLFILIAIISTISILNSCVFKEHKTLPTEPQLTVYSNEDGSFSLVTKDNAYDALTQDELDSLLIHLATDTIK